MASHLFSFIYRALNPKQLRQQGFTLAELLVSVVMSSLIIAALLYLVVELLGVNTREEALTQTQQDMRRALDYINADASESVYIYADPTTVTDATTGLTDLPGNSTPVLAFWRIDSVDTSGLPATCSGATEGECDALKVRQFTNTLVVYLQQVNSGNDIWEGPRRILRYELTKYSDVDTLTRNTGYFDPTENVTIDGNVIGFENWVRVGSTTDGTTAVLTDYVDDPLDDSVTPTCPANYEGAPNALDNFYICARGTDSIGQNRSLIVYLRGNALDDKGVVFGSSSDASRLPTLESEVLIRGVIEEQPAF